jgi:alanine racemase
VIGFPVVRPTFAQIDLDVLKANYRALRAFVADSPASSPQIIAVVKANAYGHGLVAVAQALETAGATMVACADIEEGVQLRDEGLGLPILVFGALTVSDLNGIFEYDLIPTVSSPSAARALQDAASTRGVFLHCHLKIDTGMNRFGFRYDNLRCTMPEVLNGSHLVFDAVYTHFATAEDPIDALFIQQCERFRGALDNLTLLGLGGVHHHAANSAALLASRACWYDAVRPGLLLYGVPPPGVVVPSTLDVRPVMSLRSRVVAVKGMRNGETSGYGARFAARRSTRVAIVPAGYADGLDVRLAGVGEVLIRGHRAPIVGSICMDSITIDVTDVEVEPGDEVVIIGLQDGDCIDANEVARWIGTVPHDILCRMGSRIERLYTR